MHLEINEVAPVHPPLIQKPTILGFHQLVTALEFAIDPARHIRQALRSYTAAIANRRYTATTSLFLKCSTTMYSVFCIETSTVVSDVLPQVCTSDG
jgi:hypothetical protein